MTFDEIRNDIWRASGRPSNWNPSTDTEDGGSPKLSRLVNRALAQIASWQDPQTFQHLRIPGLISSFNRYSVVLTDTIAAIDNSTFPYYMDLTSAGTSNDEYNDWGVEITSGSADGKFVVCMDYTGASRRIYYNEAFSTAPSIGDTVKLYKNFDWLKTSTESWASEHITVPSDFVQILSIVDVTEQTELKPALAKEKYERNLGTAGVPTEWGLVGKKVLYDYWIDTNRYYRIEYYRKPVAMVNASDEPEIPETYHQGIVLWGLWKVQTMLHEVSKAQATYNDLVTHMRSLIGAHDVKDYRIKTRMSLALK